MRTIIHDHEPLSGAVAMGIYTDRQEAGLVLAEKLENHRGSGAVVVALPRGGVPVAAIIAEALHLPMDITMVKKIGHPLHPELAIGAVSGGSVVIADDHGVPAEHLREEIAQLSAGLREKEARFRGNRPPFPVAGRTVIIVDDGIATGSTMRAAVEVLRSQGALKIVIAVPVAPLQYRAAAHLIADEYVCPLQPKKLHSVGQYYIDFDPVEDEEVTNLLELAHLHWHLLDS